MGCQITLSLNFKHSIKSQASKIIGRTNSLFFFVKLIKSVTLTEFEIQDGYYKKKSQISVTSILVKKVLLKKDLKKLFLKFEVCIAFKILAILTLYYSIQVIS